MDSESALPFSAVKKVNFTNSDDEELIEKVSGYEILWKLNHPDYKSNMKKDVIWNKIGVTLNITDNVMDDTEDWMEIAAREQLEYNKIFGPRKWDEIYKNDLFKLKKVIGYATCGNPKELPASNNYYTGYNDDDLETIKLILGQIINYSDCDPIKFACIFLIVYAGNELSRTPVFKIGNSSDNIFIDTNGRLYYNWESFMNENQLPKCTYCYPLNGEYNESQLTLGYTVSPACNLISQASECVDTVASVAAIGATVASVFVAAPVLMPVVGVASIYHASRSFFTLYDRNNHKQSVNLGDREARNAWLNIVGSAVGFGTAAAVGKAQKIVDSGKQLSKLSVFGLRALNTSSVVFNGFGFVDNLLLCKEKYVKGALTPLDVFHLSCEVLFFYNAIASAKATSDMLNKMSQVNISEAPTVKKLTKTQKRNLRKKLSKQRAKLAKSNVNVESSSGETALTTVALGMVLKLAKGFVPGVEVILYRYQSIGHDIYCWMKDEINEKDLINSLLEQLPILYKHIMEDISYMMNVVNNLRLKVKELFQSACHAIKVQFCILIQKLDNRIESLIRNTNEEFEALNASDIDNEDHSEYIEQNLTEEEIINEEGINTETKDMLSKIEASVVTHFTCDSLEDCYDIIESAVTVMTEEFSATVEQYKRSVDCAKKASKGFDLNIYNETYGIKGECGQHFFNQTLEKLECRRNLQKLKNVLEKKHQESCRNVNILEGGNSYYFECPSGKGKLTKSEIINLITANIKLENLEENNVDYFEAQEDGYFVSFISNKNDNSEIQLKTIAVYYKINEDNTTSGLFNIY